MFDPDCPHCKPILEHRSGEPLEEIFSWGHGMVVYDVDKAREIVKDGRQVHEVETSLVAQWVSYTGVPGTFNVLATGVNEDHIDHVLDSKEDPIIFAYSIRWKEEQKRALIPIDGNHRIAKAIKYSQPFVYAVMLSEEETDGILTDNRPPPPKARKTRKKKKVA